MKEEAVYKIDTPYKEFKERTLLYLMVGVLIIAGMFHFFSPQLFLVAMPPYIPFHLEIIYLTGFIELLLAIGISLKKFRKISALLLTIYFLAILPAHFNVSLNQIPMFGIKHPIFLWGRTAFQSVFIWWAWRLRSI